MLKLIHTKPKHFCTTPKKNTAENAVRETERQTELGFLRENEHSRAWIIPWQAAFVITDRLQGRVYRGASERPPHQQVWGAQVFQVQSDGSLNHSSIYMCCGVIGHGVMNKEMWPAILLPLPSAEWMNNATILMVLTFDMGLRDDVISLPMEQKRYSL